MLGSRREIPSFLKKKSMKEKERSSCFLKNGGALLEELIASSNGKYNPFRNFTAKEIISATNNFRELVMATGDGDMYQGSFEKRPVLIEMFLNSSLVRASLNLNIHDIAVTAQMSHHKNVLKLLGCCLEFKTPALVYEYASHELLTDLIYKKKGSDSEHEDGPGRSFLWERRLRIAKDIANTLVYLHTAFPTPIIYRDLKPDNVFVDQFGVAKLFDFSLSIALPPGKLQVEDIVVGTYGFAEPDYVATGIITSKTDVYTFGVFLLLLLTGWRAAFYCDQEENRKHMTNIADYLNDNCVDKDQLNKLVDSRILRGGTEQEQQLQAFLALAMRCIQVRREDRPEMIDVAKELRRIERSVHPF